MQLRKDESLPQYIYAGFGERGIVNMAALSVYRLIRVIFVSVWFYFIPFIVLFGSYYVPFYMQMYASGNGLTVGGIQTIVDIPITPVDFTPIDLNPDVNTDI